jgi:ferredoxin
MIVVQQKPLDRIREMIADYDKILILGCGTCATVSFAGGEKEVQALASILRMADKVKGGRKQFTEHTIKRQCEWEFVDEIEPMVKQVDAILSLGCGIGVQAIAERFPDVPVFPGLDTSFMGLPQEQGVWSEMCAACGNCILDLTAGICPIARCSKSLLNGPCGGSHDGKCEVSPDLPCAWQLIIERLTKLGRLHELEDIMPPKDWSTSAAGGARRIVRSDLRITSQDATPQGHEPN